MAPGDHIISRVRGLGSGWFQCSCTGQFHTKEQADAHLRSVQRWKANDEIIRRAAMSRGIYAPPNPNRARDACGCERTFTSATAHEPPGWVYDKRCSFHSQEAS